MISKILSLIMAAWIGITAVWLGSEVNTIKGALMITTCFFSGLFAYWLFDFIAESD